MPVGRLARPQHLLMGPSVIELISDGMVGSRPAAAAKSFTYRGFVTTRGVIGVAGDRQRAHSCVAHAPEPTSQG